MKHKILWIEDGSLIEVSSFAGPVFTAARYDLEVARNLSDALKKLTNSEYDAVIVDIRIPPGDSPEWEKLYGKSGDDKINARLGIQLLFSLLKPEKAVVKIREEIPRWISPEKFGVFTVESSGEVRHELKELGINFFRQKMTKIPTTTLLELIEDVINSSKKDSKKGGN